MLLLIPAQPTCTAAATATKFNVGGLQASQVVSVTYEHLARLSIFVDVARKGELTSPHDRYHGHFEELFHDLEADAKGGLYTLMHGLCALFRHLSEHRPDAAVVLLEPDVVEDIGRIEVDRPEIHAERHIRDYATSVSTLRVAQRLTHDMRRLVRQL